MSKPRPYRVYKRTLGFKHVYVGCYATFEAAEREARIVGGYVSVRTLPHASDESAITVHSSSPKDYHSVKHSNPYIAYLDESEG